MGIQASRVNAVIHFHIYSSDDLFVIPYSAIAFTCLLAVKAVLLMNHCHERESCSSWTSQC
jgi:hypothetical protein